MERRALYVSHTGMTEPLGRSQVVPYLVGLRGAGWRFDLVAFEPSTAPPAEVSQLREELSAAGIDYWPAVRSPSHSPLVKAAESLRAFTRLLERALRRRPTIVHARSYLPGFAAFLASRAAPFMRFIFDCRGLMGDEYVDAGHWSRSSGKYRLVKRAERVLFGRADAVVTLTERLRTWLRAERFTPPERPIEVVPCAVDLDRFDRVAVAEARRAVREEIGAGDRFVLVYAGSLASWYCEEEMAELYARLRARRPARFLCLTRADSRRLEAALARAGVPAGELHLRSIPAADMPRWLAAADGALSLIRPVFSKIASSPVKLAEYLASGLPVVCNRGIGDVDELMGSPAIVDAGAMSGDELERAAQRLLERAGASAGAARALARERFALSAAIDTYRRLYERLA
jgi:glycosyltransferase involved in cell wall biosynthesis